MVTCLPHAAVYTLQVAEQCGEASRYLACTARVSVNIRGFLASESESLTDSRSMQSKRSTCLPAVLQQLLDIAIIGGN